MTTVIFTHPTLFGPGQKKTLEIPAGWYRVLSGAVKPGDRLLNCNAFSRTGETIWNLLPSPLPAGYERRVKYYCCLIRQGEPVEQLCPRCCELPVLLGYHYCKPCCRAVVQQLRKGLQSQAP